MCFGNDHTMNIKTVSIGSSFLDVALRKFNFLIQVQTTCSVLA